MKKDNEEMHFEETEWKELCQRIDGGYKTME